MRSLAAIAISLGAVASCIKPAAFECTDDIQCEHAGVAGTCEPTGACSFPDSNCRSGRRYGSLSGALSDQCVGAESETGATLPDAGLAPADASPDAPPDAPSCPSTYTTLPGGGTKLYRLITEPAPWAEQRANCRADVGRTQLVVPGNAAELQAISKLAGTDAWIGIYDAPLEGSYITSYNEPATFLPWGPGEPDNMGNQDCVRALADGQFIETQLCAMASVAVCECVP